MSGFIASPAFWLFAIIGAGLAAFAGISETRNVPLAVRIILVPLYALAGLAMGIAAYFHKGTFAIGAGVVSFVLISLLQVAVRAFDAKEGAGS